MTKKISGIISDGIKNPLFHILMSWGKIAGPSNRDIMVPVQFKNKELTVVVPNGMVAKTALRFKKKIIENIIRLTKIMEVKDIKFVIDSALFNEQDSPAETKKEVKKICDKKTSERKKHLVKMGISPSLAESFAQIEQLLEKTES